MLLLIVFYALTLPWPFVFEWATGPTLVLCSVFLFQLLRALGELNSHPLLFELVPADKRSTAFGISNCLNSLFGGIGALIVGHYRASLGFQAVFGMVPILITLSVGGLLAVYVRRLKYDLEAAKAARTPTA